MPGGNNDSCGVHVASQAATWWWCVVAIVAISAGLMAASGPRQRSPRVAYPVLIPVADIESTPKVGPPPNLLVPPISRALIQTMWQRSGTFRQQCARIAGERDLLIRIHLRASRLPRDSFAATRVVRGTKGLEADVYVPADTLTVEIAAHELEHIIEQLDGVDLPRIARRASGIVWNRGDGAFETLRAVYAGRRVAAEMDTNSGSSE